RHSLARTSEGLAAEIEILHDSEHAAYGDSWKRRGATRGSLANIARKPDRLATTEDTETASATAGDLRMSLTKYQSWRSAKISATDLSDGTGVVNRWIADLIRSAYAVGRPYPAEFLATDINSSLLDDRWGRDETRTLPEDKLNVVILMSRRAARHVLGLWREGK